MSAQSLQRYVTTSSTCQPSSGGSTGMRWHVPPQSTQVMVSATGTRSGWHGRAALHHLRGSARQPLAEVHGLEDLEIATEPHQVVHR